jgi:hypothetical protein
MGDGLDVGAIDGLDVGAIDELNVGVNVGAMIDYSCIIAHYSYQVNY